MSIVTLISPDGMSVTEWTDMMSDRLWVLGTVPRLETESEWRDWGAALLNVPAIHGIALADPYQFDDWRRWAEGVIGAFASVDL